MGPPPLQQLKTERQTAQQRSFPAVLYGQRPPRRAWRSTSAPQTPCPRSPTRPAARHEPASPAPRPPHQRRREQLSRSSAALSRRAVIGTGSGRRHPHRSGQPRRARQSAPAPRVSLSPISPRSQLSVLDVREFHVGLRSTHQRRVLPCPCPLLAANSASRCSLSLRRPAGRPTSRPASRPGSWHSANSATRPLELQA